MSSVTLPSESENNNNMLEDIYKAPMYFGTENSTIITTQIGATAHLPCTIHHIGEGVVSSLFKCFFLKQFYRFLYNICVYVSCK